MVNRKRPKIWLPIADGLTNVVVYNQCTATWLFCSRAAFRALSVTSLGISAPMMTIIHSYTKADQLHRFPKDGVIRGTCKLTNLTERLLLHYLITSLWIGIRPSLLCKGIGLCLLNLYSRYLPWNLYGDKDTAVLKNPLKFPAVAYNRLTATLSLFIYIAGFHFIIHWHLCTQTPLSCCKDFLEWFALWYDFYIAKVNNNRESI